MQCQNKRAFPMLEYWFSYHEVDMKIGNLFSAVRSAEITSACCLQFVYCWYKFVLIFILAVYFSISKQSDCTAVTL